MPRIKKFAGLLAIAIVVVLLILIVTPFFINADRFRPEIEGVLSQKLGRKVQLGHIRVSLFSGSLSVDQISISDDPAYSAEPFLTAKSLSIGIDVIPLIFSRTLLVHSLNFNNPHVRLLRTADGRWNFASLGTPAPTKSADDNNSLRFLPVSLGLGAHAAQENIDSAAPLNSFSVDQMKISNAQVAFGRGGQETGPPYQNVNLSAEGISETSTFPVQFAAKTPSGGQVSFTGKVGPMGNNDGNHIPFEGQAKAQSVPAQDVENLMAVLGYALPAGSDLKSGTIQADLALRGPLEKLVAGGPVKLDQVTLAGFSLASKLSMALGQSGAQAGNDTLISVAEGNLRYGPRGVRAENLNVEIASVGSVTGSGTVSPENTLDMRLIAKLSGSSPIARLTQISLFNKGGGIPFRVEGNASNPQITADVPGLTNTPINQLKIPTKGQLGNMLGGLLKKKTPQ